MKECKKVFHRFCFILIIQVFYTSVYGLNLTIPTDSTFIGPEKYKTEIITAFQNNYNRRDSIFRIKHPGRKLSDSDSNKYLTPFDFDGILVSLHLKEIENIINKFLPIRSVSTVGMSNDGNEIIYRVSFRTGEFGTHEGTVIWKIKKGERVKFHMKLDF